MGQENSKSKVKQSDPKGRQNHPSPSKGRAAKQKLSDSATSGLASEKNDGTSVDVTVNNQFQPPVRTDESKQHVTVDDKFQPLKKADSECLCPELSEMDTELQKMILDKYINLKGDIDEVREQNTEIMDKILLLEQMSEEKKKQRAKNKVETAKLRETVSNGFVQTGRGVKTQVSEEENNNTRPNTNRFKTQTSHRVDNATLEMTIESDNFVSPSTKIDSKNELINAEISDDTGSKTLRVDINKDEKSMDNKDTLERNTNTEVRKEEVTLQTSPVKFKSVSADSRAALDLRAALENHLSDDIEKSGKIENKQNITESSMEGFTDTFELTIPQQEYNLMLRRTKTNENQDNRLAVKFSLQPVTGCICSTLGSDSNQTLSGSSRIEKDKAKEQPENDGAKEKAIKIKQRRQLQEATTTPICQNPSRSEKPAVKRWSVWNMQQERMHHSRAHLDPNIKKTDIQATDKSSAHDKGLNIAITEEQISEGTKIEVSCGQKQPLEFVYTVDKSGAIIVRAPAMAQIGQNAKAGDGEKINEKGSGLRIDPKTRRMKFVNADEIREGLRELFEEMGQLDDEEFDEVEAEQLQLIINSFGWLNEMCSDEGIDLLEATRAIQATADNEEVAEAFGESLVEDFQTVVTACLQILRSLELEPSPGGQQTTGGNSKMELPSTDELALPSKDQPSVAVPTSISSEQAEPSKAQANQGSKTKDMKNMQEKESVLHLDSKGASKGEVINEDSGTDIKDNNAETEVKDPDSVPAARPKNPKEVKVLTDHDSEDEKDEAVVLIDESSWVDAANDELKKGKACQDIRERGMDTIICLDMSSSMRGEGWNQALTFIRGFIECIQNTTLNDSIYEHVALVTFGSETRVQQHMTCDYFEVLRKLDKLKPRGPSPMLAGIYMSLAALRGAGSVFNVCGYKIHPRVFLITDGKATPAGMIAGPDHCSPDDMDIVHSGIFGVASAINHEHHWTINPVPVGNFDLDLLKRLATATKGKVTSPEDWKTVSRTMKNFVVAGKAGSQEGIFGSTAMLPLLLPILAEGELTSDDHAEIAEFLATRKRNENSDDEDPDNEDLPPLGTRIRRKLKVAGVNDACNIGTVTKRFSDGHIGVTWDDSPQGGSVHEKVLFSGIHSINLVSITEEPRVLRDELIAVGCTVRRGKDWHYGNQDGGPGNHGTVFVVDARGLLRVRWKNGHIDIYRFGSDGAFDVEVVSPKELGPSHALTDPSTEGAAGMTDGLQGSSMFDSEKDEDEDSDTSISSDDSDLTLEERMNRKNAKKSNLKSSYIIKPSKSMDILNDSMQSTDEICTDDNNDDKVVKKNSESELTNCEIPVDIKPENISSKSDTEKISSKDSSAKKPENIEMTSANDASHHEQVQAFKKSGAKPKQPLVLTGRHPSTGQKNQSAVFDNKNEAGKQLPGGKQFRLSIGNTVSDNNTTAADQVGVSSPSSEVSKTNQENAENQSLPKLLRDSASVRQSLKNQKNLKPCLQLPSKTMIHQTPVKDQASKLFPSDKEIRDETASQTPATASWCWNDGGVWQPYPEDTRDKIEKSFQSKKPSAVIKVDGKAYRVVFSRMEQVDISTKMTIKVQRQ